MIMKAIEESERLEKESKSRAQQDEDEEEEMIRRAIELSQIDEEERKTLLQSQES